MSHVRVLVVDDDPAVRRSLSTALGRDGYEVQAADGGGAALACLLAASVDAIVLDVAMPEPNGLEVCRRLRARGDTTPILMLTARDLVDDRVAGLDAGADDYLVKPFALAELRARLRALLRRNAASAERLTHGDLVLDVAAARVTRGGRARSPSPGPSTCCSSCSCAIPAGCSATRRSSSRCGDTTSGCARTICGST